MSTEPTAINEALRLAQQAMPGVHHDARNQFARYDYVSAESMILHCRGALHSAGLTLSAVSSIIAVVDGVHVTPKGGDAMPLMMMHRVWCLAHDSGTERTYEQDWPVVVEKGRPLDKAVAGADTASLSYLLRNLLMVPRVEKGTDLNADGRDHEPPAPMQPAPAYTVPEFAHEVADQHGWLNADDLDRYLVSRGGKPVAGLTDQQRARLLDTLAIPENVTKLRAWLVENSTEDF